MTRLLLLMLALCTALMSTQAEEVAALEPLRESIHKANDKQLTLEWYDVGTMRIEGKGWNEPDRPFTRLPAKAEAFASKANWNLSFNTAGLGVEFKTNSPTLHARWSGGEGMFHMPATGMSGLDLYERIGAKNWEYVATGRPATEETTRTLVQLSTTEGERHFLLMMPLYKSVQYLEIGVEKGSALTQPAVSTRKPIVFYGTSITQGGCASRAGMAHVSILRRWLDWPTINLGFSGSGKMEMPMADLIAEIDASLYVLDCVPNMTDEEVEERLEQWVLRLRELRPKTPILLVEHIKPAMAEKRNRMLKEIHQRLVKSGQKNIGYLEGASLLKGVEEGTVDGIHPTDLGFYRMAVAFKPAMQKLLPKR